MPDAIASDDEFYEEVIDEDDGFNTEDIVLEGSDLDKYEFEDNDASDYTEVTIDEDDDAGGDGGDDPASRTGLRRLLALLPKPPAQRAAGREAADQLALSESTHEQRKTVLIRHPELEAFHMCQRDELVQEETERTRLRCERERERRRTEEEETKRHDAELSTKLERMSPEARRAFEEQEAPRQTEHIQQRLRRSAIKAQTAAEAATVAQREALDAIERQSAEECRRLEEEARMLQARIEEARRAAAVAKTRGVEAQARLRAKIKARREAAKHMLAQANSAVRGEDAPPPMFQAAFKKLKERDPQKERAEAAKLLDGVTEFYSFDQLKKQSVPGLDYRNREKYLSDTDFQAVFSCTKGDWADMPNWKKTKAKKALGLF